VSLPFPEHGKIVVLNPEVAARAVEQHPERAQRVFAAKHLKPTEGYLIDLDAFQEMRENLGLPPGESR